MRQSLQQAYNVCRCLQATKGNHSQCFYSLPEFQEWKDATENFHTWKVKYYKGESLLLTWLMVGDVKEHMTLNQLSSEID